MKIRPSLPSAAALAAVLAACGGAPPAPPVPPARPVRVAAVADTVAAVTVVASGTLGVREALPLAFKVGGIVSRVAVDAGTRVRAGQLLAVLDTREIDAGVARAQAGLEKAERDAARVERLYRDSVVTRAQYDDARTAVAIARADLDAVAFNRGRAVIVAPAAGVVLQRLAEPGQLVQPGQPIVQFGSGARGQAFRTGLVDRDALRVRPGDTAELRFEALPDRRFAATVAEIAGSATPGTGTYEVVLRVEGAGALPDGLVGQAVIRVRGTGRQQVVPIEAMVEADGHEGTVFAYDPGTRRAARRTVRIAALDGRRVAIADGLAGVRTVVTEGAAYLNDGDAVQVVP